MSESHSSRWRPTTKEIPRWLWRTSASSINIFAPKPVWLYDWLPCSHQRGLHPFPEELLIHCCFLISTATVKTHWIYWTCLTYGNTQSRAHFVSKSARLHVSDSDGVLHYNHLMIKGDTSEWIWGMCVNLPLLLHHLPPQAPLPVYAQSTVWGLQKQPWLELYQQKSLVLGQPVLVCLNGGNLQSSFEFPQLSFPQFSNLIDSAFP